MLNIKFINVTFLAPIELFSTDRYRDPSLFIFQSKTINNFSCFQMTYTFQFRNDNQELNLALQDAVDVSEDIGLTKGNSLFSEVDDRRLVVNMIDRLNRCFSNHSKIMF